MAKRWQVRIKCVEIRMSTRIELAVPLDQFEVSSLARMRLNGPLP